MRKLGRVQQHTLSALRRRGSWAPADPWRFGSRSDMARCMASLVQSGHARVEGGRYYPNPEDNKP